MIHNRRISAGVVIVAAVLLAPIGASVFYAVKDSVITTARSEVATYFGGSTAPVLVKAPSAENAQGARCD